MFEAVLVCWVLTIIGFLWYLDRLNRRNDVERDVLLNRIQAPEKAIYRDFDPPKKQHVGFDDDADYWASKRENGEMK